VVAWTKVPCVGSLAVLKWVFGFFSGFEEVLAGVWESAVRFVEDIAEVAGWMWVDVVAFLISQLAIKSRH
jgi:hypothetical protein